MSNGDCPFCARIENCDIDRMEEFREVCHFEPINPVTPGHRLFVPIDHAEHPDHRAVADAFGAAEWWGGMRAEQFNLITSSGSDATQTVPHVHVHYVPRHVGDGLTLPWTGQGGRHVDQ